jgi:hypothetical protein
MSLQTFQHALDQLRAGTLDVTTFCARLRTEPLPPGLPPKLGEVLGNLLDRMESGALFAGESCSFSHEDLSASFHLWIDKARERLATP